MRLELAANKINTDTATILQTALMKGGLKRPAIAQKKLLLHNIYKAAVSYVENTSTDEEKQNVLEAIMDIPDERLKDFQVGDKLIRIKHSTMEGKLTEWDVEAVTWRENAFNIIREVYPILKGIREFHELLGALDMAVTPESRNLVAPQTSLEIGGGRKRGRAQ